MTHHVSKGTPLLAGWAIALAAGLVAAAVAMVVIGLGFYQSAFIGAILVAVVGLILGFSYGPAAHVGGAAVRKASSSKPARLPASDSDATPAAAAATAPAAPPAESPAAPPVEASTAPEPAATHADASVAAPTPDAEVAAPSAGRRPEALVAARAGGPDDLKRIKGIGPKLETLCHSLGFYHFDQIANWTFDEIAWVDGNLEGFKGRVTRDDWVAQAKILARGGETEFSARSS